MKVWRFLQRAPDARTTPQVPDFIVVQAENLVRIINESAQLAAKSSILETRQSRLGIALDRLAELKALAATYPRITLTQLEQLERGLMEVQHEIDLEASLHPTQRGGLYGGWEYCAAMRLLTPLRQLALHGELDLDKTRKPDGLDNEHGGWRPKLKTFRQIGVDMDEPDSGWMSSNVGPIPLDGGDYLRFLIAVRTTVEAERSVEERMRSLSAELARAEWTDIVSQPGHYAEGIVSYFFPRFLATIPGLPYYTIDAMWDVALHTPNRVAEASDKQLLAFKGIGPAMLRKIRARCIEMQTDRDQPLLDLVSR